jgi:hypothetical protein
MIGNNQTPNMLFSGFPLFVPQIPFLLVITLVQILHGGKAPHSVEIQTFLGLFWEIKLRVFRSPSGVVRSCPLNSAARSADNPCFCASVVSVEFGEQATSSKNNLPVSVTDAQQLGTS